MRWRHPRGLLIFGGIFAAAIALHLPALLHTRPFCCDNLLILEWANQASLHDAVVGDPRYPLEWRPLPHLLIWAQYRLWGVGSVAPYFLVNLALWAGVVWLTFRLVREQTGSALAAAVAAVFLLTSPRTGVFTEFLMGKQTALASLFGLAALNVALTLSPSRARAIGVFALLPLAGLGKEYGLAFAGGLVVWGLLRERRDLALAGAGALALYLALRLSIVGGAPPPCEDQAFMDGHREICIGRLEFTTTVQMAYNSVVGLVHTIFPGFFGGEGLIGVSSLRLLQSAFWLPFIVMGARRGRLPFLALLILAANVVLLAPLFRARNTIVGLSMLAIVIAFGFHYLREWCRQHNWMPVSHVLHAGVVLVCIHRAAMIPPNVDFTARSTAIEDPCDMLDREPVDPVFVTHIKTVYGLPDPHCSESAPERVLQGPELIPPSDRDDWM